MQEFLQNVGIIDPYIPEQPEEPELPVLVTARFEQLDNGSIALQISGVNTPYCYLTIIHEGRESGPAQHINGDKTAKAFFVRDAEAVMILARHQGAIIANALLEVRPELIESIGKFANPTATFNMIVEQVDMAGSERRIAGREAPALDETIRVSAVKVEVTR